MEHETQTQSTILEVQHIPLDKIVESAFNPRRVFEPEELKELAATIKQHGVLQPVTFRKAKRGRYELVFGAKRFRASKLAACETLPGFVREFTDEEVMELQLIENNHRSGVNPLDEANIMKMLIDRGYTPEQLADKIGKSVSYIHKHLRLPDLIPHARDLFRNGRLTLTHVLTICKLNIPLQQRLTEYLIAYNYNTGEQYTRSVSEMKKWISDNTTEPLNTAPWQMDDALLHLDAGACLTCTHNSGGLSTLFPEFTGEAKCLNKSCFRTKHSKFLLRAIHTITQKHGIEEKDLVKLTKNSYPREMDEVAIMQVKVLNKLKACSYSEVGIIASGNIHEPESSRAIGQELFICRNKKCEKHWPQTESPFSGLNNEVTDAFKAAETNRQGSLRDLLSDDQHTGAMNARGFLKKTVDQRTSEKVTKAISVSGKPLHWADLIIWAIMQIDAEHFEFKAVLVRYAKEAGFSVEFPEDCDPEELEVEFFLDHVFPRMSMPQLLVIYRQFHAMEVPRRLYSNHHFSGMLSEHYGVSVEALRLEAEQEFKEALESKKEAADV